MTPSATNTLCYFFLFSFSLFLCILSLGQKNSLSLSPSNCTLKKLEDDDNLTHQSGIILKPKLSRCLGGISEEKKERIVREGKKEKRGKMHQPTRERETTKKKEYDSLVSMWRKIETAA